jgi:hypothetical protein
MFAELNISQMLNCFNAREHTRDSLAELLYKAGWQLTDIRGTQVFQDEKEQLVVATPI